MAAEPETQIEVVGKRGKCICCARPGRRRKIVAKCGRHGDRTTDYFCIPCAKNVARQLKWSVYYANPPVCCRGTVELGITATYRRTGQNHSRVSNG